jgi:hypothetical protein
LYSASQVAEYRTGFEPLARLVTDEHEKTPRGTYSIFESNILEIVEDIFKDIISPILLTTSVQEMVKEFNKQLPILNVKIRGLNKIFAENKQNNLEDIVKSLFNMYEQFEQILESQIIAEKKVKETIFQVFQCLKDFDNIYLGIALNRPDRLDQSIFEIKRDGDLEDLEKSIAGTMITFFCLLVFVKEKHNDDEKLIKLLEIANDYSIRLEGWADTLDIMSNPEEAEQIRKTEQHYKSL